MDMNIYDYSMQNFDLLIKVIRETEKNNLIYISFIQSIYYFKLAGYYKLLCIDLNALRTKLLSSRSAVRARHSPPEQKHRNDKVCRSGVFCLNAL